jgi:hypothetical protein
MFNFTTTTILNSLIDSSGSPRVIGTSHGLNVLRVNNFKKDGIVSVYKQPYTAGAQEIAKVTIPTVQAGKVIRLTLDIRLSQQTDSEYANTYLYFKKPVVVEVLATGDAQTDAKALIKSINGLKTTYGFSYVTASLINTSDVQVKAVDNNQRFYAMTVETDKASTNSIIQPEYDDVTAGTFSVTNAGKVGFGDDEYMIRSIMLPTYENNRYFGVNKEERPIAGGNYTQYTLRYNIAKNIDYNIGITGMGDRSITNHVFYVADSQVGTFESILVNNAGLVILNALPVMGSFTINDVDNPIAVSDTSQLSASNLSSPSAYVTYTSATPAVATVSSDGLVTGITSGTSVITGTEYINGVATGAKATLTVTIFA